MEKVLKTGSGWRVGWNPQAGEYKALLGGEDWAIELTETELTQFCALLTQLTNSLASIAGELMEEEKVSCEAENEQLWMELDGYPHAYSLQFILHHGRRCEGKWPSEVVPELVSAILTLRVY